MPGLEDPAARREMAVGCFDVFSAAGGDTGGRLTPVGRRGALPAVHWLCHQARELVGGECEHGEHAVAHQPMRAT